MAIEKLPDGRWYVDVEPVKGRRFRRTFKTKAEAVRFEAHKRSTYVSGKEVWKPGFKDTRKLSELIELWYGHHGLYLSDPERRKRSLCRLAEAISDPVAQKLTPAIYLGYRKSRTVKGVSAKTLNNELGYVKALYNYLW